MMGSLGGYTVGRSLRFRSSASAYLNRTPASASNRTTWTWSGWVKRGQLGAYNVLFSAANGASIRDYISFDSNDRLTFDIGDATLGQKTTTQVFRDPSAWYHIVVAEDTTQATANNRIRMYVNGVEVTAFALNSAPTQNYTGGINNNVVHRIANAAQAGNAYLDGYLAEVNFIDGQALTPSSFGAYDTNGIWQPKKYSGTYGTNGFYLPFNWSTNTSYAGSFNGSTQYLTVPTNTAFDFGSGNFTIEAWVLTDSTTNRNIVAREYNGNGSNYTGYIFSTTQLVASTSGSGWEVNFTWSLPSANQWHHYALVRNGNVYTVYIDGISVGTQTVAGTLVNGYGSAFTIGYRNGQGLPNGSISNLRVVKGTAVYTGNFTPPSSALTAISGTSLLTLQNATIIDNSTNAFTITNVGTVTTAASSPFGASVLADASGNNNGWFGNNINYSSYGTTYDSMIDSPTVSASSSNYAVLNPIGKSSGTLTDGNLQWASSGADGNQVSSTIALLPNTGKFYCEVTLGSKSTTYYIIGLLESRSIAWSGTYAIYYGQSPYASIASGDVIGIAVDTSNGAYQFYKNGSSASTPSGTISLTGQPIYFGAIEDSSGGTANYTFNFGQRPFSYTPPTGYNALNTYNLPAPSIKNGAQYFAATTYTGNGTSQSITNGGNNTIGTTFQPDLVWAKIRSTTGNHSVYDSVRGTQQWISTNLTNAEGTYPGVTAFNSNGFTIGSDGGVNTNAATYVGWQWKKGATQGFDIITYTGNGSSVSAAHSLGVAPSLVITKSRNTVQNWVVYHNSVGTSNYLRLNTSDAQTAYGGFINPTSTQIFFGGLSEINTNGSTYVAYCFAAVAGYSAFGKYTGNGSSDGPFVYLGFRPRYIMIKNITTGGANYDWVIADSSRETYNTTQNDLAANTSGAEASGILQQPNDFLSNGFKIRASGANAYPTNASGSTYIYAAFAENPFNYSRAR